MDKEKMLKMLLDDLKGMTDKDLIKEYEGKGMLVSDYNPNKRGQVCFYEYEDGIISGDICLSDTKPLFIGKQFSNFEVEVGVA